MNNYVIVGIIAAVVVSVGIIGAYAMSQTNTSMPSSQDVEDLASDMKTDIENMDPSQDVKDLVSDMKTDIENIDPGYGQVTEKEGAYSP